MHTSPSQRLLQHALKDDGLSEVPGKRTHPRILRAIKLAANWLDDDDSVTPWCGCLRGLWGLETATGVPPAHYRAKSWLDWGTVVPLKDAVPGDTVILRRPGGYHVALFLRCSADTLTLFGGNQGNTTKASRFPLTSLVGIRRSL